MYFLKRNPYFKTIWTFVRFYSFPKKTHYEVLNLRKNCTEKEIKDAFIQLSKEYHPDKNKSAKAQENFVRIVEAYNVLGKPSSRAMYDNTSHIETTRHNPTGFTYAYKNHTYTYDFRTRKSETNTQSQGSSSSSSNSYYGVKGIHKLPNIAIIMICFGIAVVGVILQVVVIRESYVIHKKRTIEKSMQLAEELERVRASARGKTNDAQTQQLLEKIVTAANPSVTTASLGQALVNEKK